MFQKSDGLCREAPNAGKKKTTKQESPVEKAVAIAQKSIVSTIQSDARRAICTASKNVTKFWFFILSTYNWFATTLQNAIPKSHSLIFFTVHVNKVQKNNENRHIVNFYRQIQGSLKSIL